MLSNVKMESKIDIVEEELFHPNQNLVLTCSTHHGILVLDGKGIISYEVLDWLIFPFVLRLLEKRREAFAAVELMRETVRRIVDQEEARKGLVILLWVAFIFYLTNILYLVWGYHNVLMFKNLLNVFHHTFPEHHMVSWWWRGKMTLVPPLRLWM